MLLRFVPLTAKRLTGIARALELSLYLITFLPYREAIVRWFSYFLLIDYDYIS